MRIVIDAFGGDNAPLEIIKGASLAQKEYGVDIVLCGDETTIKQCIEENAINFSSLEIVHASDVISMHDDPTTLLKAHKDSSMAVAFRELAEGRAEGRAEGQAEKQLEIAKKLKESEVDYLIIASATGLPIKTIEQI